MRHIDNDHQLVTRRVNHHAHTTASDGSTTPQQTLELARRHDVIIGITDHNTVSGLQSLQQLAVKRDDMASLVSTHIMPGIEVQSKEHSELLIYGDSIPDITAFYREVIHGRLSKQSSLYDPVNISITNLIQECIDARMRVIIPHFALRHYGIHSLSADQLDEVVGLLQSHQDYIAVEHNPHLFLWQNHQATRFAKEHNFPVVVGADSHDDIHHRSYTKTTLDKDASSVTQAYFNSISSQHPKASQRHMEPMSKFRSLKHSARLLYNMGVEGMLSCIFNRGRYEATGIT